MYYIVHIIYSDSKVYGVNMWPSWGRQDPGGPHVGPMDLVIWGGLVCTSYNSWLFVGSGNEFVSSEFGRMLNASYNGCTSDTTLIWHILDRMNTLILTLRVGGDQVIVSYANSDGISTEYELLDTGVSCKSGVLNILLGYQWDILYITNGTREGVYDEYEDGALPGTDSLQGTRRIVRVEVESNQDLTSNLHIDGTYNVSLIAKFMGPTWGPRGTGRTQMGPMLAT